MNTAGPQLAHRNPARERMEPAQWPTVLTYGRPTPYSWAELDEGDAGVGAIEIAVGPDGRMTLPEENSPRQ